MPKEHLNEPYKFGSHNAQENTQRGANRYGTTVENAKECPLCGGSGKRSMQNCGSCGGTGKMNGMFINKKDGGKCDTCEGTGEVKGKKCEDCNGSGYGMSNGKENAKISRSEAMELFEEYAGKFDPDADPDKQGVWQLNKIKQWLRGSKNLSSEDANFVGNIWMQELSG